MLRTDATEPLLLLKLLKLLSDVYVLVLLNLNTYVFLPHLDFFRSLDPVCHILGVTQ